MHGNVDTLLVLRQADGKNGESLVLLEQEKQRSMPKGKSDAFRLDALDVGEDQDEEIVTVSIARPVLASSTLLGSVAQIL
jgi:hypothetical protein